MEPTSKKNILPEIEPLQPRWEPKSNPRDIAVPGLDTTASVQDQIEQIEQLITIKLQNIDANFARANQILSSKILPSFKRFATSTEPVRNAARFWNSFFEEAAQTRITPDEYSVDIEQHSATVTQTESTETGTIDAGTEDDERVADDSIISSSHSSRANTFDPNVTPSESSFMPAHGAISSTPMAASMGRRQLRQQEDTSSLGLDSTRSSWAASMESPLERIDRDLRSLQDDPGFSNEPSVSATPTPSIYESHDDVVNVDRALQTNTEQELPQQQRFTSLQKGKGKQPQPTLLQNVLSKNLQSTNTHNTSPLKLKPKPKTPKRNPYVPAELKSRPKDWDGIVDLSKPLGPKRRATAEDDGLSSDESDEDRFLHGMSPPITMDFARPLASASAKGIIATNSPARIGRTPVKEAAARIGKDLIGDAEKHQYQRALFPKAGAFGGMGLFAGAAQTSHSTQQSISSPSLSRYAKKALGMQSKSTSIDTSLESLLRQVAPSNPAAKGSYVEKYGAAATAIEPAPIPSYEQAPDDSRRSLERYGSYAPTHGNVQDDSFDSFDGDESYIAPQHQRAASPTSSNSSDSFGDSPNVSGQVQEDSFGSMQSSDSDSFDADDNATGMPVHPLARGGAIIDDGFDDSFDDSFDDYADGGGGYGNGNGDGDGAEPTETVFGVRAQEGEDGRPLRFHGEEVFDTGDGLTAHMQRDGDVPFTPTPMYGR